MSFSSNYHRGSHSRRNSFLRRNYHKVFRVRILHPIYDINFIANTQIRWCIAIHNLPQNIIKIKNAPSNRYTIIVTTAIVFFNPRIEVFLKSKINAMHDYCVCDVKVCCDRALRISSRAAMGIG